MSEFTSTKFVLLLAVVFPLMFVAAAVYLQSNICIIISVLVWMGVALTMIYLPLSARDNGDR
jgi:hypothetical protein